MNELEAQIELLNYLKAKELEIENAEPHIKYAILSGMISGLASWMEREQKPLSKYPACGEESTK